VQRRARCRGESVSQSVSAAPVHDMVFDGQGRRLRRYMDNAGPTTRLGLGAAVRAVDKLVNHDLRKVDIGGHVYEVLPVKLGDRGAEDWLELDEYNLAVYA